jgi:hypothetical protein
MATYMLFFNFAPPAISFKLRHCLEVQCLDVLSPVVPATAQEAGADVRGMEDGLVAFRFGIGI